MEGQGSAQLCNRGCGFYGSPATRNLCSNCYRDYLKEQGNNNNSDVVLNLSPNSSLRFNKNSVAAVSAAFAALDIGNPQSNEKKKKKRCLCCNKKVGIIGFQCRCGGTFCGFHRYPETHECKIVHKSTGRAVIAKENPSVGADKLIHRI